MSSVSIRIIYEGNPKELVMGRQRLQATGLEILVESKKGSA
jgi:hypothetical protein